jgi:hypothetical protein
LVLVALAVGADSWQGIGWLGVVGGFWKRLNAVLRRRRFGGNVLGCLFGFVNRYGFGLVSDILARCVVVAGGVVVLTVSAGVPASVDEPFGAPCS